MLEAGAVHAEVLSPSKVKALKHVFPTENIDEDDLQELLESLNVDLPSPIVKPIVGNERRELKVKPEKLVELTLDTALHKFGPLPAPVKPLHATEDLRESNPKRFHWLHKTLTDSLRSGNVLKCSEMVEEGAGLYLVENPFLIVAQNGHVRDLAPWICSNIMNYPQQSFQKFLHDAVQANVASATAWLIRAGVDVNAVDCLGRAPLHCASGAGDYTAPGGVNCVSLLLRAGAQLEQRAERWHQFKGMTALHFACHKGAEDIVRRLLVAQADVDAEALDWINGEKVTPLSLALNHANGPQEGIAKLLNQELRRKHIPEEYVEEEEDSDFDWEEEEWEESEDECEGGEGIQEVDEVREEVSGEVGVELFKGQEEGEVKEVVKETSE